MMAVINEIVFSKRKQLLYNAEDFFSLNQFKFNPNGEFYYYLFEANSGLMHNDDNNTFLPDARKMSIERIENCPFLGENYNVFRFSFPFYWNR